MFPLLRRRGVPLGCRGKVCWHHSELAQGGYSSTPCKKTAAEAFPKRTGSPNRLQLTNSTGTVVAPLRLADRGAHETAINAYLVCAARAITPDKLSITQSPLVALGCDDGAPAEGVRWGVPIDCTALCVLPTTSKSDASSGLASVERPPSFSNAASPLPSLDAHTNLSNALLKLLFPPQPPTPTPPTPSFPHRHQKTDQAVYIQSPGLPSVPSSPRQSSP